MSDLSSEELTPFQRLILSRFPGQTPPADAFAGWSRAADPSVALFDPLQAGLTLRPLGEGASMGTYGLPTNLLRGSGVVPVLRTAASAQASPPNRAEEAGLLPTPAVPDYTADLARYGQALQEQAHHRVTQQDLSAAEAGARSSGFQAGLQALPQFDPTDAAYRWSAVVPQSLGAPQRAALPTRPAPGHSALAQGLAALAGLADPRGAGSYSAMPLAAGIEAADRQYHDRQQQFALTQEQMNAQYAAERAEAEQANRFALVNAEEGQATAVRARQAQDEAAVRSVPYAAGAADASALATGLPTLANEERTSLAAGAEAAAIQEKINLTDKQYAQALEAARYTNNPLARIQVEALRQQGFYYRALQRKLAAAGSGDSGSASTPPPLALVRPPVPTPSSPAATRKPATTATPPGRPTSVPKSRFAPGNPNAPNTSTD